MYEDATRKLLPWNLSLSAEVFTRASLPRWTEDVGQLSDDGRSVWWRCCDLVGRLPRSGVTVFLGSRLAAQHDIRCKYLLSVFSQC